MTYKEYNSALSKYDHAISRRRSLLMTIRMNEAWQFNVNSVRGMKRQAKIEAAKKELALIIVPPKPKQPIGYQLLVDGDYEGFFNSDDKDSVFEQALEFLTNSGREFMSWELVAKPRFSD